jgi:hypothetical protein
MVLYSRTAIDQHRLNLGQAHGYRIDDAAEDPLFHSLLNHTNIETQGEQRQ